MGMCKGRDDHLVYQMIIPLEMKPSTDTPYIKTPYIVFPAAHQCVFKREIIISLSAIVP